MRELIPSISDLKRDLNKVMSSHHAEVNLFRDNDLHFRQDSPDGDCKLAILMEEMKQSDHQTLIPKDFHEIA